MEENDRTKIEEWMYNPIDIDDVNRIWAAVLLQACKDIVAPEASKEVTRLTIRRRALAWMYSKGDDTFGFSHVCQILGLNAEEVRERISKLPRDQPRRSKWLLTALVDGFPGKDSG